MRPKTAKDQILPPLLFPGRTASERAELTRLKAAGLVRPIGPKLYTSVPKAEVKTLVRSSWALIVSRLFPKALISHFTALNYKLTDQGEIFLTANTQRDIALPGVTLRFIRGPAPINTDVEFLGMKASSFERALLENLSSARGRMKTRAVPQETIELRLEDLLKRKGETELNQVRKRARQIASRLNMKSEFKKLDKIIGALLGSQSEKILKSNNALARAQGVPFDPECFGRLEILFGHLRHLPFKEIKDEYKSSEHFLNKAFFEAYFSNYIEGTIFEVQEAERIVFDKVIPENRPADAHDILGTFKLISDPNEMRDLPETSDNLEKILKHRHSVLLEKRPDVKPGKYKTTTNRAGNTVFVHPDYIRGTLQKGFGLYQSLPEGLARAIYMMFLVSEIHPFNDGNGRIARIMMNAELYSKGLCSVIIPTVYRDDYLLSLRALTRRSDPKPYVKMLSQAHEFSHLDFSSYAKIKTDLKARNWFAEPDEARIIWRAVTQK